MGGDKLLRYGQQTLLFGLAILGLVASIAGLSNAATRLAFTVALGVFLFGVALALAVGYWSASVTRPLREATILAQQAAAKLQATEADRDSARALLTERLAELRGYQGKLGELLRRQRGDFSETLDTCTWIGSTDQDDADHAIYVTTAGTRDVQWRLLWFGSRAALTATGGLHKGLQDIAVVTPEANTDLLEITNPANPEYFGGMVTFRPEIRVGQSLKWEVTTRQPGTWAPLRTTGKDYYSVEVTELAKLTKLTVAFVFPLEAREPKCELVGPNGQALPEVTTSDEGGTKRYEWAMDDPPLGEYRFYLYMRPHRKPEHSTTTQPEIAEQEAATGAQSPEQRRPLSG